MLANDEQLCLVILSQTFHRAERHGTTLRLRFKQCLDELAEF